MTVILQGCSRLEPAFPLCRTGVKNRYWSTMDVVAACAAGRFQRQASHAASYPSEAKALNSLQDRSFKGTCFLTMVDPFGTYWVKATRVS
jgi:hypothetical protein